MTARPAPGGPGGRRPDVGLQSERTAMAWQRTALGVAGVSALMLHQARGALEVAPGVAGLTLTLVLLVVAERRYDHAVATVAAGGTPLRPRLVRAVAIATTALAVAVLLLTALGPG